MVNILSYLDPGSLSIMWQAIAAGIIAGLAGISFFWKKIKFTLQRLFKKKDK